MTRSASNPTTTVMSTEGPSTERSPSSWRCRMLRPSCSGVSGLGQGRPSRVPIPAARMTTWTGTSRPGAAGAGPVSSAVVARSASTVVPSSGGGPGGCCRREEQVEDALGGVPVLEVAEGGAEVGVAGGGALAHPVEVGEGVDQLRAGLEQRPGRDLRQVDVEAAQVVPVVREVVGEEQDRLAGDG